jgi:WD40 repeat protein/serine/threonine protein kinase
MSDPAPTQPAADRNLLFGILTLQMDFISRDALIAGMHAWVLDKAKPLGQILVDQGALKQSAYALLDPLVQAHLEAHGGDGKKSLAAISSLGSAVEELKAVADADVQASLAHISANRAEPVDPYATTAPSMGVPTSTGLRFRVLRPHDKGGLGEVFVARDEELPREVALKQIQERHADNPESRARFVLEAEVTGGLEHPGIVPVYGLGKYADGRPFYAMRFIKGDNLKEAIRRFHEASPQAGGGSNPPDSAGERNVEFRQLLRRFIDVCNAIAYAHSRGVLHRDLKPGNIMLGKYGETLVVDWGLAKVGVRGDFKPDDETQEATLRPQSACGSAQTQMGATVGTPAFMSPEQAIGQLDQLGPASDIYSLGATLYVLLTGRAPITGEDVGAVLARARRGDFLPPAQAKARVPLALDAICCKAMALKPGDRYASALDLAADIEHWLADEPVGACPEPWPVKAGRWMRRHRTSVTGAAALLAAALPLLSILFLLSEGAREKLGVEQGKTKEALTLAMKNEQLADERREKLEWEQGKTKDALALAIKNEQLARERALQSRFDHLYFRAHEEPAVAMVGWAQLLPEALALDDHSLAESIRLQVSAWSREVNRLRGVCIHTGAICAVAFSPDGNTVLTGSRDNTARMWEVATGNPVGMPLQHEGEVTAVAFSPDGNTVLTRSEDKTARLWEAATGKPIGTPLQHQGLVFAAAFSPNSKIVVTGSLDKTARLWEAATGKPIGTPLQHQADVIAVAFSSDSKIVITGSSDHLARLGEAIAKGIRAITGGQMETSLQPQTSNTARLWNTTTGEPIGPPLPHKYGVLAVALSPDGKTVLTGSADGAARLWETATGKLIGPSFQHQSWVIAVSFSPDGKTVLTESMDGSARQWEAATAKMIGTPLQHQYAVDAVHESISLFGESVLTGIWNRTGHPLEADTRERIAKTLQHQNADNDNAMVLSLDGKTVLTVSRDNIVQHKGSIQAIQFHSEQLTVSRDNTARLWETATGKAIGTPLEHQSDVFTVAFSPDGKTVLTGSGDRTARLWETATGKAIGTPLEHQNNVFAVAFSPDGKTVLTGSVDKTARLWETATGKPLRTRFRHQGPVHAVAFSPDGKTVLTGSYDKTARLWEAATGRAIGTPFQHEDPVVAVAFSPDGKTLLTVTHVGSARLWEAATGKLIGTPLWHHGPVTAVAFSPNAKTVLTGSVDKTARLWEAATGNPIGTPFQHKDEVCAVAFSPDDKTVLTGSKDQTARLWEAVTGKPIGMPLQHQGSVWAVAFSPDGNTVLTGSEDKMARLWRFPRIDGDPRRILLWTQVFTGIELDEGRTIRLLDPETWRRRRQQLDQLGGPVTP